jgi:hypothetical protein
VIDAKKVFILHHKYYFKNRPETSLRTHFRSAPQTFYFATSFLIAQEEYNVSAITLGFNK